MTKMPSTRKDNPLLNIGINIVIPSIILVKLSSEQYLGPVYGILLALAFPLIYGLFDLVKEKKWNFISILGVVSIMLTGGIGLMELPVEWIAVKEAAVPLLIGIAIIASMKTKFPLVQKMLNQIIDVERVNAALQVKQAEASYSKRTNIATYIIAASFLVSATLNFILAKIILVSPTGTSEFTAELGRMTALSYPIIALPSTLIMIVAIIILVRDIEKLTGLEMEDIFNTPPKK